jgi:Protein of unknown function (DUF2726)
MKILLVGTLVVAVLVGIWWYRTTSRQSRIQALPFAIPPGAIVSPVRVLTEEEVALYNLLCMVVQERYLIFTQLPLWSFVTVDTQGKLRSNVLRHMALKRVDFVLVHPGSCMVEQVVQIEQESLQPHQAEGQHVIESVLDAAGIKRMTLQSNTSYSLPDLAARLGIQAEES